MPVVKKEPDEIVIITSPECERPPPPPPPTDSNQREIRRLKRLNLSYLRQLKFWANTVKVLGSEHPRRPTVEEQTARRQLVSRGDWSDAMEGIETVSFAELGLRFGDVYGSALHNLQAPY